MNWQVHQADVLEWALEYKRKIDAGEAEHFHVAFCDSPYGLGDEVDVAELLRCWLADEDFDGQSAGFMGSDWDCVPSPKVWRALDDICYPGAVLAVFAGTRTADLLGVSVRLGGFEKFDEIEVAGLVREVPSSISWYQAQGFPKSTDVSKKIDAVAGVEREVVGHYQLPADHPRPNKDYDRWEHKLQEARDNAVVRNSSHRVDNSITAPASPQAQAFHGYGSHLKPSHEIILLFRKKSAKIPSSAIHAATNWDHWHSTKKLDNTPKTRLAVLKRHGVRLPSSHAEVDVSRVSRKALYPGVESDVLYVAKARRGATEPRVVGRVDVKAYREWYSSTYAAHALVYGTGALAIDACRVAVGEEDVNHRKPSATEWGSSDSDMCYGKGLSGRPIENLSPQGRFPPNLYLCHLPPHLCSTCHGDGCDGCEERGLVGGCERVGVKRIKGGGSHAGGGTGGIWSGESNSPVSPGYADADGRETVAE